ncbi:cytidylate kinase [Paecilomyces variotii No. 5]|uniref:Cytidylate kinase n=1 Tax=Byssochlamys spectabilis (strain No. 5 / NBRC 109023) TaxID=1356009 RepID=V5G7N0_BYSSN|nr:cytidylate kinase [Paecilomyces variotii No. 5]
MAGITIPSPPVRRSEDEDPIVITSPPRRRTLDDARFILIIAIIGYILKRRIYYPGGPGSGKSTVCARLAADLDLIHLDVDAMLLEFEGSGPDGAAAVARSARQKGRSVPVGLIISLLQEEILWRLEEGDCTFLLDGFPGDIDQYFDYARFFDLHQVIHLECSPDSLHHRSVDLVGASMDEESPDSLRRRELIFLSRLAQHASECRQAIHFLSAKGIVSTVNADGTLEEVYGRVKGVVDRFLDDFAPSGDEEDPSASTSTTSSSSGDGGVRVFHLDP